MGHDLQPVAFDEAVGVPDAGAAGHGDDVGAFGDQDPSGRGQVGREGDHDVARGGQGVVLRLVGDAVGFQHSAGRSRGHTSECLDGLECARSGQLRRGFSGDELTLRGGDAYTAAHLDLARLPVIEDVVGTDGEAAVGDDHMPTGLE